MTRRLVLVERTTPVEAFCADPLTEMRFEQVELPAPVGTPEEYWPLARLLGKLRYKPGWKFEIRQDAAGPWGWYLWILAEVEDAYHPGVRAQIANARPLPFGELPDDAWMRLVHSAIWSAEGHEIDEWFVVDGERPFDPHRVPS